MDEMYESSPQVYRIVFGRGFDGGHGNYLISQLLCHSIGKWDNHVCLCLRKLRLAHYGTR